MEMEMEMKRIEKGNYKYQPVSKKIKDNVQIRTKEKIWRTKKKNENKTFNKK